jgi:hypothetical protein
VERAPVARLQGGGSVLSFARLPPACISDFLFLFAILVVLLHEGACLQHRPQFC